MIAGAVIAAVVIFRESTTPVDVETAVSEFRAEPGTTDGEASSLLPEPGVYTYTTSGAENVDALDGRSHDYPAETTITVRHEGCGTVHEWRPLEERWDTTVTCPRADGTELLRYSSHHEFFGIVDEREFACDAGSLWFPDSTTAGTAWTVRCSSDDVTVLRTGTVTGLADARIGGVDVEVLTYELHDEITGAATGINDRVMRVVADTGLIVGMEVLVDVRNDSPIGDVHYQELYKLELVSLTPRR